MRIGGNMQLPITTGSTVPGHEVLEIMGLVFGAGNSAFGLKGTASKAGTALNKAEEALAEEARAIGANGRCKRDYVFRRRRRNARPLANRNAAWHRS